MWSEITHDHFLKIPQLVIMKHDQDWRQEAELGSYSLPSFVDLFSKILRIFGNAFLPSTLAPPLKFCFHPSLLLIILPIMPKKSKYVEGFFLEKRVVYSESCDQGVNMSKIFRWRGFWINTWIFPLENGYKKKFEI